MDPFGEIAGDCVVSISQEFDLGRSLFRGESVDGLVDSSAGDDDGYSGQIPEYSTGIFICSPPHSSSDEEEEEEGEASAHGKSRPGVQEMSAETLGNLNKDADADAAEGCDDGGFSARSSPSKRKSTVGIELGSSSGSKTKKIRFSEPHCVENVNASVDLGLSRIDSKGKSLVEKDLGFFERIKSRFFTGKSPDLSSPEPKGYSLSPLRIGSGDNAADAVTAPPDVVGEVCQRDGANLGFVERSTKRPHASEEKSPAAEKNLVFSKSKGNSSGKSMVVELLQGIDNIGDADATVPKGKSLGKEDLGFLKSKGDSFRQSTASELLERINNVGDADATISKGKSPAKRDLVLSKSTGDSSNEVAAKYTETFQESTAPASLEVSKEKSLAERNPEFSKQSGDSSIEVAAKDWESVKKSKALALPELPPGNGKRPSSKRNAILPYGESPAAKNLVFSESPEKLPTKSPAKDQPSKPTDGIPNASKDPPSKQASKDTGIENLPSDIHHDLERDPSGKNAGLPIDVFPNFRCSKSSNPLGYPPLKLFKEAMGIAKKGSTNVPGPRKLPPSIQGPSEEKAAGSDRGGKLITTQKIPESSNIKNLLDMVKALSKESDRSIGNENILEVAKRAGYVFPRPQWWRPEGYSKT
ncbi:uncharacterized protein LOC131245076 isoform X1 [Magnolia sinica]|uniref:uncharacterized protein LOC131245076 isoform X1 n=1 Tax=Magnolia sinica TaxID=86752 RepID=UPI002659312D|nr:uncharacterized protein LOC131245076 isoform X1 [Magnolia sinica]